MGLMSLLMLLPYAGLMIVLVNNSTRQNKHTAAKIYHDSRSIESLGALCLESKALLIAP